MSIFTFQIPLPFTQPSLTSPCPVGRSVLWSLLLDFIWLSTEASSYWVNLLRLLSVSTLRLWANSSRAAVETEERQLWAPRVWHWARLRGAARWWWMKRAEMSSHVWGLDTVPSQDHCSSDLHECLTECLILNPCQQWGQKSQPCRAEGGRMKSNCQETATTSA